MTDFSDKRVIETFVSPGNGVILAGMRMQTWMLALHGRTVTRGTGFAAVPGGMTPRYRRSLRLILLRYMVAALLMAGASLLTGCGQDNPDAQNQDAPVADADAARFLDQSTWGPSEAGIQEIQQKGFERFLNEQFTIPASSLGSYINPNQAGAGCPAGTADYAVCVRDKNTAFPLQIKFFQNALYGRDQLRQRLAFALSQILVVSALKINQPYSLAPYQDLLAKNAFGNFRDILMAITLSPAMGRYLDMVNNSKPDPASGTAPNENYARELLQLFSIGIFKLNRDGTLQKDAIGRPTPAYDEETIEGFSHAFTGWTYPTRPGNTPQVLNPAYYVGPMVAVASNHDTGTKKLLDGVVLPAQQTPEKDLNDAINNVFNHPNVGTFIGKQLIQHLVTSNPSPAYVSRVTDAFNDNGQGVRGDMKAVTRAILLDAEARGDAKTDPRYGKLREPVKFIAGILRALDGKSDGVFLRAQSAAMGQDVYQAPSVFNFYPPAYPLPGTSLVSPVSAIHTAATALGRANFVYTLLYTNDGIAPDTTVTGAIGTKIDLSSFTALADDPEKLMDKLDRLMMHRSMSGAMRDIVIQAVNAVPAGDRLTRARTAVYLVATSPQYQVEK